MKSYKLPSLSLAIASALSLSAQNAPAPAPAAAAAAEAAAAPRRGGGGNAWSGYVMGSTLAQARALQEAAAASGSGPLNAQQQAAVTQMNAGLANLNAAVTDARNALAASTFADTMNAADIQSKTAALGRAELALANARADAFGGLQATANKLTEGQVQNLARNQGQGGRGGGGGVSDLQAQVAGGLDFSPKPWVFVQSPEEEAKSFLLQPGFHMTPVLWDPYILEANQIAFDGNGRMFVNEMRGYMQDPADNSRHQTTSRISMHEDLNNDGVLDQRDRHTVFVDGLVSSRYVLPIGIGTVIVVETDNLDAYKYTDTNNDGVADKKELFAAGIGMRGGNIEHQTAGLTWGLDNWMYATYINTRSRWTPTGSGSITEPSGGLGGQWGITFDNYGKMYSQGGASGLPAYYQLPIHYGNLNGGGTGLDGLVSLSETWGAPMIGDMQGGVAVMRVADGALARPTAGAGNDIFRGDRLPADMQGDYFYGEAVARIVRRVRPVTTEGITQMRNVYTGTEFIKGTDPLFRPTDMTTAPDGTLYITDMYRGIIQEATWTGPGTVSRAKIEQYGLDRIVSHGRVFRLTYDGIAPDRTKPNMGNETSAQLVAHLQHPNGWWRDIAQQNLIVRQDKTVVPALQAMVRTSGNQLARIHALWTLEGLGALDAALVREQLKNSDAKIRIQAARASETLIRGGDTSLIADVKELAKDTNPDVVIQSMLTVGYVKAPDAVPFIQTVLASNKGAGVTSIGNQLVANGGTGSIAGGRGGGARGGGRGGAPAGAAPATAPAGQ